MKPQDHKTTRMYVFERLLSFDSHIEDNVEKGVVGYER